MKLLLIDNRDVHTAPLLRTIVSLQYPVLPAYSIAEALKILQNPHSVNIVLLPTEMLQNGSADKLYTYLESTVVNIAVCATVDPFIDQDQPFRRNGWSRLIHAFIPSDISPLHLQNIIWLADYQHTLARQCERLTRQLEHERQESRSSRIILDELDTAVLLLRPDHSIIRMNSSGYALFGAPERSHGITPHACLHRHEAWLGYLPDADRSRPRRSQQVRYIPELRQGFQITRVPLALPDSASPSMIIEYWNPDAASPLPSAAQTAETAPAELTNREGEVLSLLLRGDSYQQIGTQLAISPHTVKNHVSGIYRKTGTNNRLNLARLLHTHCP